MKVRIIKQEASKRGCPINKMDFCLTDRCMAWVEIGNQGDGCCVLINALVSIAVDTLPDKK